MIYREAKVPQIFGRTLGLLLQHGQEVVGDKFNMDLDRLMTLAHNGVLKMFIMEDDGGIHGHVMFVLGNDPLRAHDLIADCIAVYVKPEFRGPNSVRMLKHAEVLLASYGVTRIHAHCKVAATLGKLYERMGYEPMEITYKKEL